MGLIINPCEKCIDYREQATEYAKRLAQGDYIALEGLQTLLDLALREETNSEVADILRDNHGICEGKPFCIYKREDLENLSNLVLRTKEKLFEMDENERASYLINSFLMTLVSKDLAAKLLSIDIETV